MAADLRQQFQALREQKKQKLLRRNEAVRQSSQAKSSKGNLKSKNQHQTPSTFDEIEGFQVDDNLNLEEIFSNQTGLQTDSDTEELADEIRELKDENGRLYKLLGEKEEEMKIFKRRWQNEKKDLTGQNIGSENVAQKIIELSRKNRELNVEVESCKTKCRQLQNEVNRLESELKKKSQNPKQIIHAENESKDDAENANRIAELEKKVSQLTTKVSEYRNQVELQKKELKIAHKVLTNELGEDVNIQSLLNAETNWRGRQQQIVNLQNKVAELQRKQAQSIRPSSRASSISTLSNSNYQSPLAMSIHDEKIRSTIKKIEQERKDNQQNLQVELDVLHKEHTRLKQKHDAAKTRNQVLTQELKNVKEQIKTLVEKGKHDDDLVSALMREQEYLKTLNAKLSKEKGELESHSSSRVVKAKQDLEINEELKRQIEEQEKKVSELENELESLKESKLREKEAREKSVYNELEQKPIHKQRPSFIPTPPTSADRKNGYTNRFRRTASASSDANTTKFQETKTMLQATEVERDRLVELVDLLQKRLETSTEECIMCENKVIEMKRTNAKLEKQIERLKVVSNSKSQSGNSKARPTSRSSKKASNDKTIEVMYEEVEELQARLEIQTDENDALKEALNSTLKAKNEDMKLYQDMVEQTKFIYLQGLKQIKQTSSS